MSMESDVNTMVVLVPKRHNPNRASNVSFFTDYESRSSSSIKRDKRRIETVPQITLHNLSCVRHYTSSPKFVPDGLCVSSIKKANVFHQCVPKKKKKNMCPELGRYRDCFWLSPCSKGFFSGFSPTVMWLSSPNIAMKLKQLRQFPVSVLAISTKSHQKILRAQ